MFGFKMVEDFTHILEGVLERARNHAITIDAGLSGILLECHDFTNDLLYFYEENQDGAPDDEMNRVFQTLSDRLGLYLASGGSDAEPSLASESPAGEERVRNECWHISLRFGQDVYRDGLDPYSFISFLGEVHHFTFPEIFITHLKNYCSRRNIN